MTYSSLWDCIDKNQTFCISAHQSPDADSVGSQLAMFWYLTSLGKDVTIYDSDPLPAKFSFLTNADKISSVEPTEKFDVLIVLDSSNLSRIGWDNATDFAKAIIDIDHHRDNSRFGDISIVDDTAAATCQILYELFRDKGIELPVFVADALYAGILADTGGFQFENTTSTVLRDAAELMDLGASNYSIYKSLFSSLSIQGMQIRAEIWASLEYHLDGRVGVMYLDESRLAEIGADKGDTEGMSDVATTGRGVEVGMLIKKSTQGVHFSLRSSGRVDVGTLAAVLPGGGGHSCAAGCSTMEMSVTEARDFMLSKIAEVL